MTESEKKAIATKLNKIAREYQGTPKEKLLHMMDRTDLTITDKMTINKKLGGMKEWATTKKSF